MTEQTRKPGLLTVTYGDETVTLDPSHPWDRFNENRAKADHILNRMTVDRIGRTPESKSEET